MGPIVLNFSESMILSYWRLCLKDLALKIGMALEHLHDNGIILKNLESSGILMTDNEIPRISRLNKAEIMGYGAYCHG